MHIWKR